MKVNSFISVTIICLSLVSSAIINVPGINNQRWSINRRQNPILNRPGIIRSPMISQSPIVSTIISASQPGIINPIRVVSDNQCRISGEFKNICSNSFGGERPDDSKTKYKPYYKCFENAWCASVNGQCKWLQTARFKSCLNKVKADLIKIEKQKAEQKKKAEYYDRYMSIYGDYIDKIKDQKLGRYAQYNRYPGSELNDNEYINQSLFAPNGNGNNLGNANVGYFGAGVSVGNNGNENIELEKERYKQQLMDYYQRMQWGGGAN